MPWLSNGFHFFDVFHFLTKKETTKMMMAINAKSIKVKFKVRAIMVEDVG